MDFKGEFETHITFALSEPTQWEQLSAWCHARGLKCVHIVLDRGLTASQPMLTRHGNGTLESELQKANDLALECETVGFKVSRVKLEVSPNNSDVPLTESEAQNRSKQCYFEHHIKLLLPTNADVTALKEEVKAYGAHLSRNTRRLREDGLQERFVTQRCKGVSRIQAQRRFEQLLQTISAFGFPVLETEEEYVVYDSNLALDAGWLEESVGL